MGLMEIRIFNRVQSPWRRLCFGWDGVVHNAEHRLSGLPGFLLNELNNGTFKYAFQTGIVPFSITEEMGNRGTVAGAVISKSMVFPRYPTEKADISMSMICFMAVCGKIRHKLNFFLTIVKQVWMVYTVFYKTSSFAGYCFLSKYSIHPQRRDVFSYMHFW